MALYTGILNPNAILRKVESETIVGAIYNMIISQQFASNNIKGTTSTLADKFRVDGSLYGDTKLYYATDILESAAWNNYSEASNLLAVVPAKVPKCQAITIDKFRQVSLTLDDYLTKQAFSDEGTFSQFKANMMQAINDTKRVYESTLINVFVGTTEASTGSQLQSVEVPYSADVEQQNRLFAETIANKVADIFVDLSDPSRDYNDYGFLRSYDEDDFIAVWNSDVVNKIEKRDLPTIFHKDGLMKKFPEVVLPGKYFGDIQSSQVTITSATTTEYRSAIEQTITIDSVATHFFPGEKLPVPTVSYNVPAYACYAVTKDVAVKLIHKNAVPFMAAFEVATSFYNPKALLTNHYLTWGHNTLERLSDKPFITLNYTIESAPVAEVSEG